MARSCLACPEAFPHPGHTAQDRPSPSCVGNLWSYPTVRRIGVVRLNDSPRCGGSGDEVSLRSWCAHVNAADVLLIAAAWIAVSFILTGVWVLARQLGQRLGASRRATSPMSRTSPTATWSMVARKRGKSPIGIGRAR